MSTPAGAVKNDLCGCQEAGSAVWQDCGETSGDAQRYRDAHSPIDRTSQTGLCLGEQSKCGQCTEDDPRLGGTVTGERTNKLTVSDARSQWFVVMANSFLRVSSGTDTV